MAQSLPSVQQVHSISQGANSFFRAETQPQAKVVKATPLPQEALGGDGSTNLDPGLAKDLVPVTGQRPTVQADPQTLETAPRFSGAMSQAVSANADLEKQVRLRKKASDTLEALLEEELQEASEVRHSHPEILRRLARRLAQDPYHLNCGI